MICPTCLIFKGYQGGWYAYVLYRMLGTSAYRGRRGRYGLKQAVAAASRMLQRLCPSQCLLGLGLLSIDSSRRGLFALISQWLY